MKSIAQTKRAADHTSYEVRKRWDKEHHKIYSVRLRLEEDGDLIAYIEAHKDTIGTSQIFREALEKYIKEGR